MSMQLEKAKNSFGVKSFNMSWHIPELRCSDKKFQ